MTNDKNRVLDDAEYTRELEDHIIQLEQEVKIMARLTCHAVGEAVNAILHADARRPT